jgi:hypothetical protein
MLPTPVYKFYSPNPEYANVTGPSSYSITNNGYIYSKEYLNIQNNGISIEVYNISIPTVNDYLFVGISDNNFTGIKITKNNEQYICNTIYNNQNGKTINQNFPISSKFSIYCDNKNNIYFYINNILIDSTSIGTSSTVYRFESFGKTTTPITVGYVYFNNGMMSNLNLTSYNTKNLPLFNNIFNQNTNNNTPSGQILTNIGSINYLNSLRIIGGLNAPLNTTFTLYIWINPSTPVFQITEKIISYNFDILIPVNIQINTPGYYISLKLNNIGSVTVNQLTINYS